MLIFYNSPPYYSAIKVITDQSIVLLFNSMSMKYFYVTGSLSVLYAASASTAAESLLPPFIY